MAAAHSARELTRWSAAARDWLSRGTAWSSWRALTPRWVRTFCGRVTTCNRRRIRTCLTLWSALIFDFPSGDRWAPYGLVGGGLAFNTFRAYAGPQGALIRYRGFQDGLPDGRRSALLHRRELGHSPRVQSRRQHPDVHRAWRSAFSTPCRRTGRSSVARTARTSGGEVEFRFGYRSGARPAAHGSGAQR